MVNKYTVNYKSIINELNCYLSENEKLYND